MKPKINLVALCFFLIAAVITGYALSNKNTSATCSGTGVCKACKNCNYCKHCAKEGGTCSVCKK